MIPAAPRPRSSTFQRLRRAPTTAVITAGVAVGLFVGRNVSELVPDVLGVGAAMFAAGLLVGVIVGIGWQRRLWPPRPLLPPKDRNERDPAS
jgi:hypothetical protein